MQRLTLPSFSLAVLFPPRSRALLHNQHSEEPARAERHPRGQTTARRGGGEAGSAERLLQADVQAAVGDTTPTTPTHPPC